MKINIVNVSGGVDSAACYLLALERGEPFRAIFADTGNEHEATLDYIANLPIKTGGPPIITVKADFTQAIGVRRYKLESMIESGYFVRDWTEEMARRVLEHLHCTNIPFLDLCLLKGRFPSTTMRFCTAMLKMEPLHKSIAHAIQEVVATGGQARDVISWVGVRRDESRARSDALEWETEQMGNRVYRPLVDAKKEDCFRKLKHHGLPPNPLYKLGCGRVGCMPCLNARKSEIREIIKRFPHHIDKIREWERLVGLCSKRGVSTFFACNKIPGIEDTRSHIDAVAAWSMTKRGGRQFDMLAMQEPEACSSQYGLCE